MNAFVPVIIFIILYLVGKWQQRQRWYGWLILRTAPTKAQMDAMKLELGKRLLPVFIDIMTVTKQHMRDPN